MDEIFLKKFVGKDIAVVPFSGALNAGVRVHNLMKSAKADSTAKQGRCTVCGRERMI